jgi:hypothetical protein
MERTKKHSLKIKDPVKGCAASDFHWIPPANLKQGFSITYLLTRLITSRQIEEVPIVVWGEITKSVQRVYDFSTWWVILARVTQHLSPIKPLG